MMWNFIITKTRIWAILCLIFICTPAIAEQDTAPRVPSDLPNVFIGMTTTQLLTERKSIYRFDFSIDDVTDPRIDVLRPEQLLAEYLTTKGNFQFAMYGIEHRTVQNVVLHGEVTSEVAGTLTQPFINELIGLYGKPSFIGITGILVKTGPTAEPILLWLKGEYSIIAIVPEADLTDPMKMPHLDIKIIHRTDVGEFIIKAPLLSDSDKSQILAPVKAVLNIAYPNEKFKEYVEPRPLLPPQPGSAPSSSPDPRYPLTVKPDAVRHRQGYFWPVWTSDRLLALRSPEPGVPLSAETRRNKVVGHSSSIVSLATKSQVILAVPEPILDFAAGGAKGRISFTVDDAIYILDTNVSTLGRMNNPRETWRGSASWNSKGDTITVAGTHSVTEQTDYDQDIFLSPVRWELSISSAATVRCVVHMPGPDILPIFTMDDNSIVYAHRDRGVAIKVWSIFRAPAVNSFGVKGYVAPAKIVDLAAQPERLSWLAGGKQLLVSYRAEEDGAYVQPDIVDLVSKTRKPFDPSPLHDPDSPQNTLKMEAATLNNDGRQIAFCAQHQGSNGKASEYRIYICNLDGKELRRISPLDALGFGPLVYTKTGVTALNAWDKLQPQYQPVGEDPNYKRFHTPTPVGGKVGGADTSAIKNK